MLLKRFVFLGAAAVFIAAAFSVAFSARRMSAPASTLPLTLDSARRSGSPALAPAQDARLAPASAALARRDYGLALRLSEKAEKQGVPRPAVEAVKSDVFRQTHYLDREIESYQRWTQAAPQEAVPWLKLFYIYLDLGWKREADQASAQALRAAPNEARCHVARAVFWDHSLAAPLALQEAEAAQRLQPANPAISNLRAMLLLKADRNAEAEAEIRKAVVQEPSSPAHHLVLAQALANQQRPDEAIQELRAVQRLDPQNVAAVYQLAQIAENRGDMAEAMRQLAWIADRNAQYGNVLWDLARLYRKQGRLPESERLSNLYTKMQKSANEFEQATANLEMRPGDLNLHAKLAGFHLAADEVPEAIVELRAVAQFRSQDMRLRRDLVEALTRFGRVTEARQLAATGHLSDSGGGR